MNKIILPRLLYESLDSSTFEIEQIEKLLEELEEFTKENDYQKKASELIDIIQVSFSLLNLFNNDIINQACLNNVKKHKTRKKFNIIGKYTINIK